MFDIKLTAYLAELSKIEFTDEELKAMTNRMTETVALMDKVKEINSNLPIYEVEAVDYDSLRSDEIEYSIETAKILENAQQKKKSSFVVPKIV